MLRRPPQLPAVPPANAIALQPESSSTLITESYRPKSVQRGVLEIMLAFPTMGMADDDRRIVRDLYLEAVDGFPRAVVEWTLKYLVFNNPRNTATFSAPPTPQDVREACEKTWNDWRRWVREFYFEPPYGERFALPSSRELALNPNAKRATAEIRAKIEDYQARSRTIRSNPKFGADGCTVPDDLQIAILRDEIDRQMTSIDQHTQAAQRGEEPEDSSKAELLLMPDEALNRLPLEAFLNDTREKIFTLRTERAERARKSEEHEAYLQSLPDLVRRVRWTVFRSEISKGWSEAQIMEETKLRLAKVQRDRAAADADGGIYCGSRFDDGSEFTETPWDRRMASIAALENQTPEQFEKMKAAKLEEFRKAGFPI